MEIAKTVVTTLDVIIAVALFYSVDKKQRKSIGVGAVLFVAANALLMWS